MLVVPPDRPSVEGPIVFLAGPIQGAPDWQSEAYRWIQFFYPGIVVASPRRPDPRIKGEFSDQVYNEQVDWETYYLRRAAHCGAVLFWLAKEERHVCTRAYAQTTRFELGEWKERASRDGAHLVVGIDDGFTNVRYIARRLAQDCPKVPIVRSLEEACRRAVSLAGGKYD